MPTLWFVVPAHGRAQLAQICLRNLRWTCDQLADKNIDASAVVIADDENLTTARELGFATVRRDNRFLSRKFNDGIQLACDPRFNPRPVDYVVPCGSDDWVDPAIFGFLPADDDTLVAFRLAAFVSEDGRSIVSREIDYTAGVGIRIYPRKMMGRVGYRPADEDRPRGCDTSILVNVRRSYTGGATPAIWYGDVHEFQIVDWKSRGQQLNPYSEIVNRFHRGTGETDPFEALTGVFPTESLEQMRHHYRRDLVAA